MLRVVLADDENKVILLMQKLIDWGALGYEIVGTANDGLRALELVREKQPHLLITDVRMPGCDGIELIQRAKALQPKLHFIVISGYRKFEYAQNALKYGVEDYLLKPLKQEELTGILLRLKEKMGQEAALEFQLKRSGEHQQELLLDGEQIVGAYKTVRDQAVFTTHRIFMVDMQGMTGTRQEIFVLPYRKILHYGIKTAGFGDPLQTSELTVCFADEHEAKFGFIGQDELLAVARAISRCIL